MGTTTASLHEGGKVSDSQSYRLSKEQIEQIQVSGLARYSGPHMVQQQNYSIFATLISAPTWKKADYSFQYYWTGTLMV